MYELKKKIWKGIYVKICWDRALVLWKKNLPGRGLTKFEKHWSVAFPLDLGNLFTFHSYQFL